jgi:hypothetical protein
MTLDKLIGGAMGSWFGTRPRDRRRPRPLRPRLDVLEGRELKDGGISLVAGTVMIEGTAAQNTVIISYTDPTHNVVAVTWNTTTVTFDHVNVSGIRFDGQGGGFNFLDNLTDIATTAHGGNGINYFLGAGGDNTFIGGDGFNFFMVTGGHDTLVGGNGTNYFLGVGSDDTVTVGSGLNLIY